MTAISMQPQIVKEPSTLVYTLTHPNVIDFDDFYLLIRANHNYMVEKISPKPDNFSVHVRLGFQASIANFQAKLGGLAPYVAVTKLSHLIHESEYGRLNELKQHYGLTASPAVAANILLPRTPTSVSTPTPPAISKPGKVRAVPYKKPSKKSAKKTESDAVPVVHLTDDMPPDTQECDVTTYTYAEPQNCKSGFYISDSSTNQQ